MKNYFNITLIIKVIRKYSYDIEKAKKLGFRFPGNDHTKANFEEVLQKNADPSDVGTVSFREILSFWYFCFILGG